LEKIEKATLTFNTIKLGAPVNSTGSTRNLLVLTDS
jgi:hypothetical protein